MWSQTSGVRLSKWGYVEMKGGSPVQRPLEVSRNTKQGVAAGECVVLASGSVWTGTSLDIRSRSPKFGWEKLPLAVS